MVKVANHTYIRRLSWKAMRVSRTRNFIAVMAIALTTILFTTLFTIAISINEGIQQNNFRQVGGYSHAGFKYLTKEDIDTLKDDPLIKEWGVRQLLGMAVEKPFHKSHVEISYCNENTAKWMYCVPKKGKYPAEGTNEAATDLYILELLGVEPVLGNEFTITIDVDGHPTTQTFILSGWWEYDEVCPAHHVLIPESRLQAICAEVGVTEENKVYDYTCSWSLDVMLDSALQIDENMCAILMNHDYQPEGYPGAEHPISYGVNWGYTGAQISQNVDPTVIIAIVLSIFIFVFTGYLIIYNVFQISVANDIRFYGLLKTIGTTPRQLTRIVRHQAVALSVVGIPIGLVIGWFVGMVLTPQIIRNFNGIYSTVSISPIIFAIASVFSLMTVLLSCRRPGKMAAKVSPVEAVRYTEGNNTKKQVKKIAKRISMLSLAKANLGRTKKKTVITIVSMSLAVVLLLITVTFASGFSMDKYIQKFVVTDYIVAQSGYFHVDDAHFDDEERVSDELIDEIHAQGGVSEGGRIYGTTGLVRQHVTEEYLRNYYARYFEAEEVDAMIAGSKKVNEGALIHHVQLYGMESFVLDQLYVAEGDLSKLYEEGSHAMAAVYHANDYGELRESTNWAKLGDSVTLRYTDGFEYYYTDNGEVIENIEKVSKNESRPIDSRMTGYRDVTYEVVAIVVIPNVLTYRHYSSDGFIINAQTFIRDSKTADAMLYTFNMEEGTDKAMEAFLQNYTENVDEDYSYESKMTYAAEFEEFRMMFLLLGGVLSFIVGLVGILNYFNAVLTSIMSRRREFAMMQSIGMTGKQLKKMLVCEGLFYALGSLTLAFVLIIVLGPVLSVALESMFWFYEYKLIVWPIIVLVPMFVLLGWALPRLVYRVVEKQTLIERLREVEN